MGKHRKKEPKKSEGLVWHGQKVAIGSIIPGIAPSAFCEERPDGEERGLYGRGQYTLTGRIVYIHPKMRYLTVCFDVARRGTVLGRIRESYCIRGGQVWEN